MLASGWGADPTSDFYALYDGDATGTSAGYTSFINSVYAREFGSAPTAANLQNLLADVPGTQMLLNGGGHIATPIQVMAGLYGYLLEVGQTDDIGQYASATTAFLLAASNGTVAYGPELTAEFPPAAGTAVSSAVTGMGVTAPTADAAGPDVITITGSNQLIDPGTGSFTIQFIVGAGADTLVLHISGVDQVAGFDPTTDVLDLRSLATGTGLDLTSNVTTPSTFVTVVDQGAERANSFRPHRTGRRRTVAVLQGLGSTVTGLDSLVRQSAISLT